MRRLLILLATTGMLLAFAGPATAQNAACQDIQDRLNAGDDSITSAELLSCGYSPEAISPCEGSPDPNCDSSGYPSWSGPGGGASSECADLPKGSAEAIACFEDFVAGDAGSASASASVAAADQYTAAEDQYQAPAAPTGVLPETGGGSLLALGAGVLLLVGGLLARRIVR